MLHVTFGCMFAGKSKQLVQDAARYQQGKVQVITHSLTGPEPFVVSRNGDKVECVKTDDIIFMSHKNTTSNLIDEAQFFPNLVPFVHLCLKANKIVHVYGLVANYKGNLFGTVHELLPHANTVTQPSTPHAPAGTRPFTRGARRGQTTLWTRTQPTNPCAAVVSLGDTT